MTLSAWLVVLFISVVVGLIMGLIFDRQANKPYQIKATGLFDHVEDVPSEGWGTWQKTLVHFQDADAFLIPQLKIIPYSSGTKIKVLHNGCFWKIEKVDQ